jgi:hypothetical protein
MEAFEKAEVLFLLAAQMAEARREFDFIIGSLYA